MPCDRICLLERLRATRGPNREIVAVREVRSPRTDKGVRRAKRQTQQYSAVEPAFGSVIQFRGTSGSHQHESEAGPAVASAEQFQGSCGSTAHVFGAGSMVETGGSSSNQHRSDIVPEARCADDKTSGAGCAARGTGHASACRSDRSRRAQWVHVLDHFPGYVLAYHLGGFLFFSLRTPPGTTVQQGHQILLRHRTGLAKRFPYVDGLMLQPDLWDENLTHVCGRGWHAHWSLERSDDGSPHYHVMAAIIGYDVSEFVSAVGPLWSSASESVLDRDLGDRPRDVHVDQQLGGQTIEYMCGDKRTSSGRDAQDFSDVVGEEKGLGTKWWGTMGRSCLRLVRGHGEVLDNTCVAEIRARAMMLDWLRWGGREVPDRCAHFRHRVTGRLLYVVHGPWLGYAAQYMATGSLWALSAYRRALLQCRERRRREKAEVFTVAFGF